METIVMGYLGIMEKKMETTVWVYIGVYALLRGFLKKQDPVIP